MSDQVDTQGFASFAQALEQVDEIMLPLGERAVGVGIAAIQEQLEPYPPQPPRDRAKHFNTYVRGVGQYPKSAFVQKEGVWTLSKYRAGKARKAGKVRLTSQQMSKRWQQRVQRQGKTVEGELSNTAGYSGYVLGSKNPNADPHQMAFHAETGWQNADDGLAAAEPKFLRACNAAVNEAIKTLKAS